LEKVFEAYDFRLSKSKTEYIECNFSKRRSSSTLGVKVGDHIIPQVTRFKYLGSIVQNDREIEADVNHRIQVEWLKWRRALSVLCDKKILFKLKEKFYWTTVRPTMCWSKKLFDESFNDKKPRGINDKFYKWWFTDVCTWVFVKRTWIT